MEKISTLIEVKVLPDTMSDGYHTWWRVGVPEVLNSEFTLASHSEMDTRIRKDKAY